MVAARNLHLHFCLTAVTDKQLTLLSMRNSEWKQITDLPTRFVRT